LAGERFEERGGPDAEASTARGRLEQGVEGPDRAAIAAPVSRSRDALLCPTPDEVARVLVPCRQQLVAAVEQVDDPRGPCLEVVARRAEAVAAQPVGEIARTWRRGGPRIHLDDDRAFGLRLIANALDECAEDRLRMGRVTLPHAAGRRVSHGHAQTGWT